MLPFGVSSRNLVELPSWSCASFAPLRESGDSSPLGRLRAALGFPR